MALGSTGINLVRSCVSNLNSSKGIIDDCINTITYVKNNNDLTIWSDDTAIGSKWSENVDKLIKATTDISTKTLQQLVQKTEEFLREQESNNNNG